MSVEPPYIPPPTGARQTGAYGQRPDPDLEPATRADLKGLRTWIIVAGVWAVAASAIGLLALFGGNDDTKSRGSTTGTAQVADLQRQVDQLEKKLSQASADASDAADTASGLSSGIDSANSTAESAQSTAQAAKQSVADASSSIGDLQSQVESLQQEVKALQSSSGPPAGPPINDGQ